MNDFAENWTKLQNTVVDVVTNPLLLVVSCYKLSIIFINFKNKRCIFSASILTPNTRNFLTNYSVPKA